MKLRLVLGFTFIALLTVIVSGLMEQHFVAFVTLGVMISVGIIILVVLQKNSSKLLQRTLNSERASREAERRIKEVRKTQERSEESLQKLLSASSDLLKIAQTEREENSGNRRAIFELNHRSNELMTKNRSVLAQLKAFQGSVTSQVDDSFDDVLNRISGIDGVIRALQAETATMQTHFLKRADAISRQIRDQVVASSREAQEKQRRFFADNQAIVQRMQDETLVENQIISKKQISQADAMRKRIDELAIRQNSGLQQIIELASQVQSMRDSILSIGEEEIRNHESIVKEYRNYKSDTDRKLSENYQQFLESINSIKMLLASQITTQTDQFSEAVSRQIEPALIQVSEQISKDVVPQFDSMTKLVKENVEDLKQSQRSASKDLTKTIWDETRQVHALLQLSSRIKPRWAMPPFGRWALDARSALHLIEIVEKLKPKSIVELGSGTSSILLGYLAEKDGGLVKSFDHLSEFAAMTREMAALHGLDNIVSVRDASLETLALGDADYLWYATEAFADIHEIDLLIVDGPPGGLGHKVRYPALPVLAEKLSRNAVVILDDSDRPDEAHILASWQEQFPFLTRIHTGISRLAVLTSNADFLS